MSFKITETNFLEQVISSREPVYKDASANVARSSDANASKIGENDLQGLLRKRLFEKSFSPAEKEVKTGEIANIAEKAASFLFKQAERFATLPDTFFPLDAPGAPSAASVHLTFGNPSEAVADTAQPDNYLLIKEQYTASYNRDRGIPNWTSWHLDSASLGGARRQNDFRPDDALPEDWYHVTPQDYSGSGYDRGHMTPSGDRTGTAADNSATFLMTNMIPQASKNNQQTWANLEVYCRELAQSGNELYIVAGGQGTKEFIAGGRVAVPEYTWKVILVQPEGTEDVSRVTAETRIISVYIPNDDSVAADWKNYLVSADYVEEKTGFDFFSEIPDDIESAIEARTDETTSLNAQSNIN